MNTIHRLPPALADTGMGIYVVITSRRITMLNTAAPAAPAAPTTTTTIPAVAHTPVDWAVYLDADDSKALKRLALASESAMLCPTPDNKREFVATLVGWYGLFQVGACGQPASADAFVRRNAGAKGAALKLVKAIGGLAAQLHRAGVKAPRDEKIEAAQSTYQNIIDTYVDAGLIRTEKAIGALIADGKAVDREAAATLLEAAQADKKVVAFAKKAKEAGFIHKDEAEAEGIKLRARIIQLEAQREALQGKIEALEAATTSALMARTLKDAKQALAV